VPRHVAVRQQLVVIELKHPAVPEQHPGSQIALAQQLLDQRDQRRAVARSERLPVSAGHRHHDIRSRIGEFAEHAADQGWVQERQVGRAHEGHRPAPVERGQPRREPAHRSLPFDRVGHHLGPGR